MTISRLATSLLALALTAGSAAADIVIGVAGPLSGQYAAFGNELKIGAEAAAAAVNASGGINGENIIVVTFDDACDPRRAVEAAKDFGNKDVRLVVGHFCSSATLAAASTYANNGTVVITPSATDPAVTEGPLWNLFRLTGREDKQVDLAVARISAKGESSDVVLITDGEAETAALAKRFQAALPNAKVFTVKAGDPKLPDDTATLLASSAYLALQAGDAAVIAKELRRLKPDLPLYGPDLLQSESFGAKAGSAGNTTHVSFLNDLAALADTRNLAKLPSTEGSTLAAYAAVEAFVAAAKAKGVNDTRGMAEWLRAGNSVASIIGNIQFDQQGDLQQQPYVWYMWQDGQLKRE
jgi:branched-chain amino acid transport system substrate-binding protein